MATEIEFEAFQRLLEDDVFCDYFNKFCSLPLFGQRVVYIRSEQNFFLDPEMKENLDSEEIAKWCHATRMKFFLKSYIYAEYKLAKVLTKFNLSTEAAIHRKIANQLHELQKRAFNRMSRFSKFCTFLNENGEGIKLVAFFISAQHVLLHHHENDQDSQFFLADLRDKFFDETSNWCLPKSLIEILGYCNDSSSTIDHCKKISQQVLNRLCTYWLPRYLLSVKLEEQEDENDPDDPSIVGVLRNLVASTSRMSNEDLGKAFSNGIDDDPSMNLFFEPSEEIHPIRRGRRHNEDTFSRRELASKFSLNNLGPGNTSSTGLQMSFSITPPDQNAFRQTRSRLTFAELGARGAGGASILRNSRRELGGVGDTRGKKLSQINLAQKQNQSTGSNKAGTQSMTSLFSRMANVKKAINKFKKPETKAPPPKIEKNDREREEDDKPETSERRTVRGTIRQSASIASIPTARQTKKTRATKPDLGHVVGLNGKKIRYKMGNDQQIMESLDEQKDADEEEKEDEKKEEPKDEKPRASQKAATPGIATILKAKSLALGWKKKVGKDKTSEDDGATSPAPKLGGGAKGLLAALKAAKNKEEEQPKQKEEKITGTKMLFAMSANKDEDNQKVKVITKRDNRLEVHDDEINEDEDTLRNSFLASINPQILNRRRGAVEKIRPLKTLKKRHLMQGNDPPIVKQDMKKDYTRTNNVNDIMDERSRRLGRKKKEFIEKALKVSTFTEKIRVNFGAGDHDPESIYSIYEDSVFRHEARHFKAALRSDEFAAGPFMAYLSEQEEDDTAVFALDFWQDIERFREEFGCMHQSELELEMDNIINKYVLNNHARDVIPGMAIYSDYYGDIDILNTVTFPWQLRIVQRKCMDYLGAIWTDYIDYDVRNFCENLKILEAVEYRINATVIKNSIKGAFREEAPPIPLGTYIKATKEDEVLKAKRARTIVEKSRKTTKKISSGRKSTGNALKQKLQDAAQEKMVKERMALMSASGRTSTVQRFDLFQQDKEVSEETKMARRSKRSYYLIEQTCRLTANLPKSHFLREESDDDGEIPDKAAPVYLRKPKIDPATIALMATSDYPKEGSVVKKRVMVRQNDSGKVPSYMKATIRKNGVVFKRPILRPKHLVDCVRDPIHFEFFRRFARAYHFERSIRFWKAVEVMKHVEDPKVRQMKIKMIVSQFFSASSGVLGVGIDGQVLREIMRTPPEKVNVSMLISAQACVMKALEDMWGERYLSTFTELKKAGPHGPKEIGRDRKDLLNKRTSGRNGTNIWKVFSAFIKRAARFVATMKSRAAREEFEQYLLTVGRDPTLYHKEGWAEVVATSIDPFMANDKMFHQKRMQGRNIIAELLINDFRFWLEVECYRTQAEHVAAMGDSGVYNAADEKNLAAKARLISDQFLSSPIPPKCRINVAPEIASTVIENIKLGMANRSLFHDITIDVFPLLLNFWKSFCEARHLYIPRPKLNILKRNIVNCRRKKQDKQKKVEIIRKSKTQKVKFEVNEDLELVAKEEEAEPKKTVKPKPSRLTLIRDTSGDGPLIDYTKDGHFSKSWIDVSKVLEETTTVNFSLSGGVKVAIGLQNKPRKSMFHQPE